MEIRSLKDWCTALDEESKVVAKYEKQLTAFYKNLKVRPDYDTPFMTGCYKKESIINGILRSLPITGIISLILSTVLFGLICLIKFFTLHLTLKEAANASFIFGILIFVGCILVSVGFKILINKIQTKGLKKMEDNLKNFLVTVPMNYRASDKMKTIAMVYFTKPTINPKDILPCVDEYLRQAGHTTPYTSVMFDLPENCQFINNGAQPDNGTTPILDTDDPNKKRSEFLPSDIDSKVFEGSKDSDKDLRDMIGLESVKDQIEKFKNRIKFYGTNSNNGCHLAFLGSAGTGKTTVARIVTKILYDLGYIKKNQYIEISGDYLCAGNTSRASAIIEYAYGGVLFIDEAYLMYKPGSEVIGVLLKAMEDHRKDFVVILAGYEEQMTKLFASNEGFSSRVKHTIYFLDYSEQEMLEIFNYFIRNYNGSSYTLADDASKLLLEEFTLEKKSKSFGNARTVRNAVDAIMDYYADRSITEKSNTHVIQLADVNLFYEDRKKALQHEIKNSSAANQLDEQIIRLSELKPRMKNGSEDPDKDLMNLIGLESFRQEIDILRNEKQFYNQTTHQKILLLGDSGCGKSTLTKILTGYLYQLGYISENKYLEIPAELLKGSYVGHTAKRAEAIISYASGGVLFVENYNALNASNDSYAGEAISALTTAVTENTDVTIVVADSQSQYTDAIKNLFTLVYTFPTYTNEQLLQIFDLQALKQNFRVADSTRNSVWTYICQNKVRIRDIQQIFNNTVKRHISNFNGDESTKFLITDADLALPEVQQFEIPANDLINGQSVELSIEAVQDEGSTEKKPKIKLNIKPKA